MLKYVRFISRIGITYFYLRIIIKTVYRQRPVSYFLYHYLKNFIQGVFFKIFNQKRKYVFLHIVILHRTLNKKTSKKVFNTLNKPCFQFLKGVFVIYYFQIRKMINFYKYEKRLFYKFQFVVD